MATDQTYTQIREAFQAASGIVVMEATDEWFFKNSLNRAGFKAWSASEIWPRYLNVSEERAIVPEYTQGETREVSSWGTNLVNTTWDNGVVDDEEIVLLSTGTVPTGLALATVYYAEKNEDTNFYLRDLPQTDSSSVRITFDDTGATGTNYFYVRQQESWRVPSEEYNKNTIGEYLRMYDLAPYPQKSGGNPLDFYVDGDDAFIINAPSTLGQSVWVTYKKEWDGPYDEDSTTVPEEFADYIIHSILADFLRGDGQLDKANSEDTLAQGLLQQQLGRLSQSNRNPYAWQNIHTHGTRQRR